MAKLAKMSTHHYVHSTAKAAQFAQVSCYEKLHMCTVQSHWSEPQTREKDRVAPALVSAKRSLQRMNVLFTQQAFSIAMRGPWTWSVDLERSRYIFPAL
eukprot:jgi/Botrbrau1/22902/Bobra.0065s0054.1